MSRATPARRNIAERIAHTLRASIVKGRLQPGEALPSERVLAQRYDVNRSSIREAMKRLEAWGLVTIRQGGATRVAQVLLDAGLSLLPPLLDARDELVVLREFHELRGLLLGWSAEQAALKADPASVARLEALARALSEPRQKATTLQTLDYDFFEQLVLISGNQLLLLFTKVVRSVYFRAPERFLPLYRTTVFNPEHHRQAVIAIRERNHCAAGDAMRAHASTALALFHKDPL